MYGRESIQELLPTHRRLLERFQGRLGWMARIAALDVAQLGGIVASGKGDFGEVAAEAGQCFVVRDPEEGDVVVVAMDLHGLIDVALAVIPEAVAHILARPPATMPILVVDAADEPAVVLLPLDTLRAS